jgi:hypothetical protein
LNSERDCSASPEQSIAELRWIVRSVVATHLDEMYSNRKCGQACFVNDKTPRYLIREKTDDEGTASS